jgi:PadR family transcriptional regulator, regulatory protein PadR
MLVASRKIANARFEPNPSANVHLPGVVIRDPHSDSFLDNRWSNVYHPCQVEGRLSSMAKQAQQRVGLIQGTLDMLILRTLLYGPAHGHQIGKHIQRTTNEFLQMQHGSLYPALHRLEERGWVVSKWETAPDRNREFKYYRLTEKGRKQLLVEESQWKQMAEAVSRVMWPAAEEN